MLIIQAILRFYFNSHYLLILIFDKAKNSKATINGKENEINNIFNEGLSKINIPKAKYRNVGIKKNIKMFILNIFIK